MRADIEPEPVSGSNETPSARVMAVAHVHGGVLRDRIEAHGPGWLGRVAEEVKKALGDSFGEGPMKVRNQMLLATAHRPPA